MTLSAGRRLIWLLLALPGSIGACQRDEVPPQKASQQRAPKKKPRPALLYLPEGGDIAPPPAAPRPRQPVPQPQPMGRCPADMVDIAGRFCIDRYESTLVDNSSGHVFSPYYSPSPQAARQAYQKWSGRGRPPGLFALDVPVLPDWQLEPDLVPLAVSKPGVIPQGYMSGAQAAAACAAANKRLCTAEEWELACRGQRGSKFPISTPSCAIAVVSFFTVDRKSVTRIVESGHRDLV